MRSAHAPLHVASIQQSILRSIRDIVPCLSICGAPSTHGADVRSGAGFARSPRFGGARSGPRLALASGPANLGQLLRTGSPRRL